MKDKITETTKRLRILINNSGKTRKEIAEELKCDTSTITKHYNGDREVNADFIIKYARYFEVSADYLLGLSEAQTNDKDIQFICDYTGLDEATINAITIKKHIMLPTGRKNILVFPKFMAYTGEKYFDIYNRVFNDFLQSSCLLDIVTSCCIESALEYTLNELFTFHESKNKLENISNYKKDKIKALHSIVEDYFLHRKLNLFNAQETVKDFVKSSTNLNTFDEEEIENLIKYLSLEIYEDENMDEYDGDIEDKNMLFGYEVEDIESIADFIIDCKNTGVEISIEHIKELNLFKNELGLQKFTERLEKIISRKKAEQTNGKNKAEK